MLNEFCDDEPVAELDLGEFTVALSDIDDEPVVLPAVALVPAASTFPYDDLIPVVAHEARATAQRIQGRLRTSYLDTGEDLIAIKDKLEHGFFEKWLKSEFGWTERTAGNFMNAARLHRKSETVSVLPASVLYKLAAPSTPTDVQDKVVAQLEAGKTPTGGEIKTWIKGAKAASKTQPAAPVGKSTKVAPTVVNAVTPVLGNPKSIEAAKKAAAIIQRCLGPDFEKVRKLLEKADVAVFMDAISTAPVVTEKAQAKSETIDLAPDEYSQAA